MNMQTMSELEGAGAAIGLDYPDKLLPDLHARFDEYQLVLAPTAAQLDALVKLAYFGSLTREEGATVSFALAFLPRESLSAGNPAWTPITFDNPRPARVEEIAKLAPALDHRQAAIVICPTGDGLEIAGIVRTPLDRYRMGRGESTLGEELAFGYVRIAAEDAGVLSIGVHTDVIAAFARGEQAPAPIRVLTEPGLVRNTLLSNATQMLEGSESTAILLYSLTVLSLLHGVSDETQGGTIAILPETNGVPSCKYRCDSEVLRQELVDYWRLERELRDAPRIGSESLLFQQRNRARDSIRATARLAAVDGALILGPQLQLLGFGGMFEMEDDLKCLRALDANATRTLVQDLKYFGARHRSAAAFAWRRSGAVVFVRSADGPMSCMTRVAGADHVLLWRPIAQSWFEPPRARSRTQADA
jgi:hypothetical protein